MVTAFVRLWDDGQNSLLPNLLKGTGHHNGRIVFSYPRCKCRCYYRSEGVVRKRRLTKGRSSNRENKVSRIEYQQYRTLSLDHVGREHSEP